MSVGGHFNPFGIKMSDSPPAGTGTVDQYEIGDLSGKYGNCDTSILISRRVNANHPPEGPLSEQPVSAADVDAHFSIHVDMNLPLFGINSIVGR